MLALKIYTKNLHPPQLIKISQFPVRIGRSLQNEVVIDHPSISVQHAELSYDDDRCAYILRDLCSTNGIIYGQGRVGEVEITHSTGPIYLGHVPVDVLFMEEARWEKTQEIDLTPLLESLRRERQRSERHQQKFTQQLYQVSGSVLLVFLTLCVRVALETPLLEENLDRFVLQVLAFCGGPFLLAAPLSFALKIHSHQYRYFDFVITINRLLAPFVLFALLWPFVAFYLPSLVWERFLLSILSIIFYSFFFLQLFNIFIPGVTLKKRRFFQVVFILVCGSVLTVLQGHRSKWTMRSYEGTLVYPYLGTQGEDVHKSFSPFLQRMQKNFMQIERYRQETQQKMATEKE